MKKNNILRKILNYKEFGLVIALIVLLIAALFINKSFFTFGNISRTLTNNSVFAILTVGIMFVLITGGIDISIGSILAVSGVSVTELMIMNNSIPPIVLILAGIAIGAACGLINGFLVGKMKIVPMIVTLGTMYVFRGLAFVITQGAWRFPHMFTEAFASYAKTEILGFDAIVFWAVGLFIVAGLFLGYTRPGRRLYAIGTSSESSKVAGIREDNVKILAYVLCGACAGLAGALYAANYLTVSSDIGKGYEMTAIAICILGGVSITGGRGRMDGVVIAVILMSVITSLLSMIPGYSVWQDALQGAIIIVAVIVNIANGSLADKRALRERGNRI